MGTKPNAAATACDAARRAAPLRDQSVVEGVLGGGGAGSSGVTRVARVTGGQHAQMRETVGPHAVPTSTHHAVPRDHEEHG